MGGAVGHLQHPYDDRELTFGSLKDMLIDAASGHLEAVSEKLDGMNLVFTCDQETRGIKVARSSGDIKRGGMSAAELARKFEDRGSVADAFNSAFAVLSETMDVLSHRALRSIFGTAARRRWYSIEIVYTSNPNVIMYDVDVVVFHAWPVFEQAGDQVTNVDATETAALLQQAIRAAKRESATGWKTSSALPVTLRRQPDGVLAAVISSVQALMRQARVRDDDTIGDYLHVRVMDALRAEGCPRSVIVDLAQRILAVPGAPRITAIKQRAGSMAAKVDALYARSKDITQQAQAPLERTIHEFAVQLLSGLGSLLIARPNAEIERIRSAVEAATVELRSQPDKQAALQHELEKLQSVKSISAALEGIVFMHAGRAYKFTGSFAPVNKILGMQRYRK